MLFQLIVLTVFPAAMAYAAAMDLLTMTIPNRISLGLVAAFLLLAPFSGLGLEAFALHLAIGAAALCLGFGMFAMGWIGGGDAKLFAATALWLGPLHLFDYAIAAALLGGVLTLSLLFLRRVPLPGPLVRRQWIARLHAAGGGVPYGIALAAAALLVYPHSHWMSALGA